MTKVDTQIWKYIPIEHINVYAVKTKSILVLCKYTPIVFFIDIVM